MFDLDYLKSPTRQRDALLTTREIAPQSRPPELARDLVALRRGEAHGGGVWRGLRGLVKEVLGFTVAMRIAMLAAFWCSSRLFADDGAGAVSKAATIAGGYLLFQMLATAAAFRSELAYGRLALAVELHLLTQINKKLLTMEARFANGNLASLVSSDVPYYAEFVSSLARNLAPALASLVILGPMVAVFAGWPGVIGVATTALIVPIAIALSRTIKRRQDRQQTHLDRVSTLVGEWLRNVRLSRFLGWEDDLEQEVAASVRTYTKTFMRRHAFLCVTFGIGFTWWMVPATMILVSARLLGSDLTMEGFFVALWVIKDLCDYLQHLPHSINLWASATACRERIGNLLKAPDLARHLAPGAGPAAGALPLSLTLRDVDAGYGGEKPVLAGLSLTIDLAETTAIVGAVGAGKTTLLRVLTGDLPPSAGSVTVTFDDGTKGNLWNDGIWRAYRAQIGYVPQEPFISNATLGTNITLSDDHAGEDALQAAYKAELEADLRQFPLGLAAPIGQAGLNLSGGQKQRVNLARALYAGRRALLLDDPLSAVDARTEETLVTTLMAQGFVLVTHRLDELDRVARIVVLDCGAVVEDGAPATLLARGGAFARLVRASRDAPTEAHP